ncbi:hypothetical protein SAY87_029544 [Trapa incisa]|uniref:ATG8-interacting protein 1 n=1 Tax=Trapa incisa TaxID=236973 RepID=A0AAN7QD86_9MYRT|nr:hypothetical protein SAY87_029544 [Trapa incisa]
MADNNEVEGANTRNDWEVVSLTASAYAATSGSPEVSQIDGAEGSAYDEAETSHALFMSGHFVFPPSQHENLPIDPEQDEIHEETVGKYDIAELAAEGVKSTIMHDKDQALGTAHVEFPGVNVFDERGSRMSIQNSGYEPDKEQSPYSASFSYLYDKTLTGGSSPYAVHRPTEAVETEESPDSPSESYLSKALEKDCSASDLPCSWWKKRAASSYDQAKDANAFWVVFVAAAVMGLSILGQKWRQERWQVLHQRWHLYLRDEKMSRMMGPIYRIKDVMVDGQIRGSLIRGSSSSEI